MQAINSASVLTPAGGPVTTNSAANLSGDDFFRLMITQLRQQDPLQPMDNTQLLNQIASVRQIELNTTLTDSLRTLTGQQRFASASSLIGQFVTSEPDENGTVTSGVVVGVRFGADQKPVLRLADGNEVPMERVGSIEPALKAAEALVGQGVVGLDRRDIMNPALVEGVVTGVRVDSLGDAVLELDTGGDLRFKDVVKVTPAEAA